MKHILNILYFMLRYHIPYTIKHKYYVFIECCKLGIPFLGIVHDISKFLPVELYGYSKHKYECDAKAFGISWLHHQHNNKHHPEYWIVSWRGRKDFYKHFADDVCEFRNVAVFPIPERYIKEMVADWRAMSRVYNDTAIDFYNKYQNTMILHPATRYELERILGYK